MALRAVYVWKAMSNRTRNAVKGTVTSFLQYGLQVILQIIIAPIVLKIAGQETLGAYSIVMQIIGYGILLDLGFSVALSRYLSQSFGVDDNGDSFKEIFTIGRMFLLVSNIIFGIIICVVAFNVDTVLVASDTVIIQARYALYFLSGWIIVRTPISIYQHGLIATQNMASVNLIAILGNGGRLILSLIFVYTGLGLIGLILANIFSEFVTSFLIMKIFTKNYPVYTFNKEIKNYDQLKKMLSFGVKYWGVNISVVLFLGSDSILVGNLYGAQASSVYYTTKIPTFLMFQLLFKLSDNAAPATNELFGIGNYEAIQTAYLKLLRYSLLLALPLAVGIVGFNKYVITVWVGVQQYAGDVMTLALALFSVTQIINHLNAMIVIANGNIRWWSTLSITSSAMCLFMAFGAGKLFGMQYVMVVISLMDIPMCIFLFVRCLSSTRLSISRVYKTAIIPSILSTAPLCVVLVFIKLLGPANTYCNIIICMLVYLVVWMVSSYVSGLEHLEKDLWRKKCQACLY